MALFVLIFLALTFPLLVGWAAEHWDGEACFAPYYHHVASLARDGGLLRWNPFSNAGSPDFAEPQYGAASPVTLLFGLLAGPGPWGFHLYWLGLWLFGGVGMYVLARALSAPPWGALVSALGLALSGYYLGHAEHLSVVYTFSFVPWTLWRVHAAMQTGRWRPACEAGALWGLSALAGNPATHFPASIFIGLSAPAFLPALPPGRASLRWAARTYATTMVLLVAVGVLVLLPSYGAFRYEAAGFSHRSLPLPREMVLNQSYGFSWLTSLFTPVFVYQSEVLPGWADYDVSMRLVYCGAPVLVLAAFAAWRGAWRERAILIAGLLCLGLAMGTTLPLRGWLYDWVPPTRFIRNTGMFRGFFVLAVTMLAAVGAAQVEVARRAPHAGRRLRALAVTAGIGALLGIGSYSWITTLLTPSLVTQVPSTAPWHLGIAWMGTLLLCLAAVRWQGCRRWLPGALTLLVAVDLSVAFEYSRKIAFEARPSMPALILANRERTPDAPSWDRAVGNYMNDNLFALRPTFVNYSAMNNLIQEDWGGRPGMRQIVSGSQRVWFATGVPTVPPTMKAYEAFRERGNALRTMPVVRHERDDLLRPAPADSVPSPEVLATIATAPAAQLIPTEVLSYHANSLTLRVVAPAAGELLVSERWARSWTTTVNGQPVSTDGGNFLFRLVPVQAGENLVVMRYQLGWWYALIVLSWTTLATVLLSSWWHRGRRRAEPDVVPVQIRSLRPESITAG